MAFTSDNLVDFFATQDTLTNGAGGSNSVVDAAFSIINATTGTSEWTNTDNSPSAAFVLQCQFATLPNDGSTISLHARKMNVQGTNDSPVPTAVNTDQFIGAFVVDGDVATSTDAFLVTNWLTLPNQYSSQVYEFYLQNSTGQTIAAGWELYVTPVTKGAKA